MCTRMIKYYKLIQQYFFFLVSGNHTLPKGTVCYISPLITHQNPELYPNPKSFNPENFNAENVAKRHKYSFISFSGGARNCMGIRKYLPYNVQI